MRFLVVVVNLIAMTFYLHFDEKNHLKLYFFDVGQGDSSLIQTPFGQNILIDAGADDRLMTQLGEALGIFDNIIDVLVISHPHEDHIGGLEDVLNKYHIGMIIYTGALYDSSMYKSDLALIKNKNIKIKIITGMQDLNFGKDCDLYLLYPFESLYKKQIPNINNTSIVSKLSCDNLTVLYAADMESDVEKDLLGKYSVKEIKAKILKVGHHGSDTSSSVSFLKTVNPDIAIISDGKNNKFGHPSKRVLRRLEDLDTEILRTDEKGEIKIESIDGNVKIY